MRSTMAVVLSGGLAGVVSAQVGPDLVWDSAEIVSITFEGDRFEVGVDYRIANIGDAPIDIGGLDPQIDNDNVGIQAFLSDTDDLSGQVFAAGGTAIFQDLDLFPSHSILGTKFSNTAQLSDPLAFGDFVWLVLDITNTTEQGEALNNNRVVLFIPGAGSFVLFGAGGLVAMRRRR